MDCHTEHSRYLPMIRISYASPCLQIYSYTEYTEYILKYTEYMLLKIYVLIIDPDNSKYQ